MNSQNYPWELREFVEALTAELDRARDLLSVKVLADRRLTYSVQDVSLNLNVFAEFDGDDVRFRTAEPNEDGASQLSLKLGSVTDRVVAETGKAPPRADDLRIEDVPDLDETTVRSLRRMGVNTKADVDRLGQRKLKVRVGGDEEDVDFERLAALMDRATAVRPRIRRVAPVATPNGHGHAVRIFGDNLEMIRPERALYNGQPVAASLGNGFVDLLLPEPDAAGEVRLETERGEELRLRLVT